jgi:hypothetical protein
LNLIQLDLKFLSMIRYAIMKMTQQVHEPAQAKASTRHRTIKVDSAFSLGGSGSTKASLLNDGSSSAFTLDVAVRCSLENLVGRSLEARAE